MKSKKQGRPSKAAPQPAWSLRGWHVAAGAAAALVAALVVYGPALSGPFVFDDQYLPFFSPHFSEAPVWSAIRGVRPLLMFTFWVNNRMAGTEPYLYHLFNVLFHLFNSLLVFFIARRLLTWTGVEGIRRESLAAFAGALFLLHPAQTEAVAYVASRSENLSALFFFAAVAVFVYRKSAAVSWPMGLLIMVLYGAAVSTKEHTVVLPAVLLLIDYFWNPGFSLAGIRRNWRLYAPIVVGGAVGARYVLGVLGQSISAGFHIQGLPWYDYFFTQWQALWIYFRLFVLPLGQSADYDFPIVHSAFDAGSIAGLAGLLILVAAAVYFRKRYPPASFGLLSALILFAPTSSVVPLLDAVAERRLYLPMLGLVLIPVEVLSRWRVSQKVAAGTAAAVLLVFAFLCYQRNQVWASDVSLWGDAVAKSPNNWRAHFQLGIAYYQKSQCDLAAREYETAFRLGKPDYTLHLDWALAEDCLGRPEQALDQLRKAAAIKRSAYVYSQMGLIYGKQGKNAEALSAAETALQIDPRDDLAYFCRANLRVLAGDLAGAQSDYSRAIQINPENEQAQRGLARVLARRQSR